MVDWYLSFGIKKYKKEKKPNKQTRKQWKKTTTKYSPY